MKLYKYLLPSLLLGSVFGLTSCSSEEDDIFGKSAAQRLEEYKKQYSADLTADGGKWLMEYFSNEEERGYVFVMTFNVDGSVKVAGQNMWIDDSYKSDVSLWDIVTDNGPVLSFNSYNEVLHLFSTPENIVGPNAPINPDTDKDINEQGTGHGGDYEFVVIGLSDDGKTMHLTGKKTLHDIYMHRLDANVDEMALLASYSYAEQNTFDTRFPDLLLKNERTGEEFVFHGGNNGIFDVWPKDGDPVVQTKTGNALVGPESVRFMKPLGVEFADESDSIVINTLIRQENGSFKCTDNDQDLTLDCIGLGNIFCMTGYTWHINESNAGGKFAELLSEIAVQCKARPNRFTFRGFDIQYVRSQKKYALNLKRSGSTASNYLYGSETVVDNGQSIKFNFSLEDGDENGLMLVERASSISDFVRFFNSVDFEMVTDNRFAPMIVRLVDKSDSKNFLVVNLAANS